MISNDVTGKGMLAKEFHSIVLVTLIDVLRQLAAEAKTAVGCRSPK